MESKGDPIDALKRTRAYYKGIITRIANYVAEKRYEEPTDLEVRIEQISQAYRKYSEIQSQIQTRDVAAVDECAVDEYEELYLDTVSRMKATLYAMREPVNVHSSTKYTSFENVNRTRTVNRLPSLEIPTYDGKDICKYRNFMAMFMAVIDKDDSLDPIQKLFYLRKYLTAEALSLIDGLPLVDESYKKSVELLNNRYDNRCIIITNHVHQILDIPPLSRGTTSSLRELVAVVRQNLGALESLAQPVQSWDMVIVPVLARKLDMYTCRAYFSERDQEKLPTIKDFLSFLERRACSLEESSKVECKPKVSQKYQCSNLASNTSVCKYCKVSGHYLYKCERFLLQSVNDRLEFVNTNNICKICLNQHANKCKFVFKCSHCHSKEHNSLLHVEGEKTKHTVSMGATCNSVVGTTVLLPTVIVNVQASDGSRRKVRALLDSGSQTSFITAQLVEELSLSPFKHEFRIVTVGQQSQNVNNAVNVNINSMCSDYSTDVKCSVVNSITMPIPQSIIHTGDFKIPSHVTLADSTFNIPGPISMLLAADVFFDVLLPEKIKIESSKCILQNTSLGYVVAGEAHGQTVSNISCAMHCSQTVDAILEKFWEIESVPSPNIKATAEQCITEEIFQKSVTLNDNRFQVELPIKAPIQELELGDSFSIALQRLSTLQRRFAKDEHVRTEYEKFIKEYLDLGHAAVYNLSNDESVNSLYFLPHHPVIRNDRKTTKLRVVFDGSAKSKNGVSLNDLLYNGPVVQKELFDVLIAFRGFEYVFLTDIRQMFRQVLISADHRRLQNILWKAYPNDEIQILQLETITYGLKSSSYLATRCLVELANKFMSQYPLASSALLQNCYVDDVISGSMTLDGAIELKNQLIELLSLGSFDLHKWSANNIEILENIPLDKQYFGDVDFNKDSLTLKALGLVYDVKLDKFKLSFPETQSPDNLNTKASILSCIGRFYDPLGLIAPILINAKLFLQKIWQSKIAWNDKLPPSLLDEWDVFYSSLKNMTPIYINRNLHIKGAASVNLIGFCDSTLTAYGCCIYVRCKYENGETVVNLLCAKSRVAPLKNKLTIPKLELSSALLLAQLYDRVRSIAIPVDDVLLYTDSQVVLAWIKNRNATKLGVFVHNRQQQINNLTDSNTWHYVPTDLNPADCLSRGVDPQKLADHDLWLHGPKLIRESNSVTSFDAHINFNVLTVLKNDEYDDPCEASSKDRIEQLLPIIKNCSSLTKMQFVIGYVYRFYNNCKRNIQDRIIERNLTPKELKYSLFKIIFCYQQCHFASEIRNLENGKEIKSNIKSLNPFLDANGVLRLGGRLQNSELSFDQIHPIILPKNCHLTELIIRREHLALLHAGSKLMLGSLSLKFWIINAHREIKKIIGKCMTCYKLKAEASKQLMGSLPEHRVTMARPFLNVGIDYCGPFDVKQSRIRKSLITKGYVVVFVCFATKCIHLELASDMSTECFLACFKRFISRRGLPANVYCDNGAVFKGANNQLKELYKMSNKDSDRVINYASNQGIHFRFIPSYSPVFGGLWEAGVKSAKHHFKRVIGKTVLTYEQFNTVISQVEAILNSRPLTSLARDATDFTYLTPAHFLIGSPVTMFPENDYTVVPENRLLFWRQCTRIKQSFWKTWSSQYLCQLQNRPKWRNANCNLEIGQLVILRLDNCPMLHWPMARICKVFPGPDKRVRVVEVQTPDGKNHKRSITKISLLPFYE